MLESECIQKGDPIATRWNMRMWREVVALAMGCVSTTHGRISGAISVLFRL
jgi:hypothetical protein